MAAKSTCGRTRHIVERGGVVVGELSGLDSLASKGSVSSAPAKDRRQNEPLGHHFCMRASARRAVSGSRSRAASPTRRRRGGAPSRHQAGPHPMHQRRMSSTRRCLVDASDTNCVSTLLSCAEADFRPVTSSADRRYVLTARAGARPRTMFGRWPLRNNHPLERQRLTVPSGTTDTFNGVWGSGPRCLITAGSTATILHGPGPNPAAAEWTLHPLEGEGVVYKMRRMHAVLGGVGTGDVRIGGEPFSRRQSR